MIKKILPKNAFARGVSVLVGGTVGAQALMVLASPLLTRLYTPEDFGLLAVYASILSLFTVIASLRYELAIPLPEKDSEAAYLAILGLFIVGGVALISALLILLGGNYFAKLINAPGMANYFWLIPVGVVAIGCYQIFNYWAIRTKSFGTIAKTKISQSLATLAVQLSGFKLGVLALMLGQTGGQSVGVMNLARPALKSSHFKGWQWSDLKKVAVRYKKFPMFSTWEGFLNTASMQLPPLLFAVFFSAGVAGLYALAHRVLAMPMSLVGSAVGNVFFANAAEAYRQDKLAPLFESVYAKLVSIIMPVMLVLIIDAPRLFAFVFGSSWYEAGELARWMAPWLAVVFISSPLSTMFTILEKQKQGMFFQGLILSVRILALGIGFKYNSMILAVILFSMFSMLCWIGFLTWVAYHAKSKLSRLLMPLALSLILSVICALPLLITLYLELSELYWYLALLITGLMSVIYYFSVFKKSFV
ncbi:polysaccharide biosynthesis protein [Thiopseudomonas alkaliphila]|uniref:oligosaccharide flippase family protein n=1 Tax=Thiopseudomonas alkaliphila TaxID=1697053 RepID=UPI00069DEAB6|nr:oligosaccharide flippase family protein [Thiopseudomonas alkaliphila]AKX46107.1 polysaccharide biosynthesis protein [Thiopseudomonas alkaliphila]AKX56102.1 polysaccharide biosynthesis protein [Thiopseudomonas alkaliphila]